MSSNHTNHYFEPREARLLAMACAPAGLFGLQFLKKKKVSLKPDISFHITLNSGCSSCSLKWKPFHKCSHHPGKGILQVGEGPQNACNVSFDLWDWKHWRPVQDPLVAELLITFRTRLSLPRRNIRRLLGFLSTVILLSLIDAISAWVSLAISPEKISCALKNLLHQTFYGP